MKNNYYFFTLPFIYLLSSNACATIGLTDDLLFSAFGSTSITQSDNKTPLYLNRNITDERCFDCDTTLGLQLDYQFLDDFAASIQVVKRPQDEWSDPALEWLYLGYNYKQYDIKVGRLRLPTFLDSEYFYVAHAYTRVRPPQEVYDSLLGVTSYDGISLKWQGEITDDTSLFIEPHGAFFGDREVTKGIETYKFKIKSMYGLKAELSSYNYRIFANVLRTDFDIGLEIEMPGFSFTVPSFNRSTTIYSFGGEYLWEALALRAEAIDSEDSFNWYAQASYSINQFMPYISYSEKNNTTTDAKNGNHTITTGIRFDFTAHISMNLEYQRVIMDEYVPSIFGKGQFTEDLYPGEDSDASVYTLMLNFIL